MYWTCLSFFLSFSVVILYLLILLSCCYCCCCWWWWKQDSTRKHLQNVHPSLSCGRPPPLIVGWPWGGVSGMTDCTTRPYVVATDNRGILHMSSKSARCTLGRILYSRSRAYHVRKPIMSSITWTPLMYFWTSPCRPEKFGILEVVNGGGRKNCFFVIEISVVSFFQGGGGGWVRGQHCATVVQLAWRTTRIRIFRQFAKESNAEINIVFFISRLLDIVIAPLQWT